MIRSKLMLCAESIVVDARTNNVSVFNIMDELSAESFPIFLQRFTVLTVLERDDDNDSTIECFLRITLADEEILNQAFDINFQDKKRTRNIVTLGGMTVLRPGTLEVSFWLGEERLGQYQIVVNAPREPSVETRQE